MNQKSSDKKKLQRDRRRSLRQRSTDAESLLWQVLRGRRLHGYKFRRQHSIGDYIVDFACVELNLVLEIDGGYHDATFEKDQRRQQRLEQQGWRVIRFGNEDVLEDVNSVAVAIMRLIEGDAPSPQPSPPK